MENLAARPLVRKFTVRRLHGYKDIGLEFTSAAKVVIAENGSGKTTLLNILDAFLTGRLSRLATIDFHSIECEFDGSAPIVVRKQEIQLASESSLPERARIILDEAGIEPNELMEWLSTDFANQPFSQLRDHPFVEQIYQSSPFDFDGVRSFLADLLERNRTLFSNDLQAILKKIKECLAGARVLYLPTYRRIELALDKTSPTNRPRRSRPSGRSRQTKEDLGPQMFFGLGDVEQRLQDITEDIGRRSNQGYRSISATILDDLLKSRTLSASDATLPDIDTLRIFFSRVSRSSLVRSPQIPLDALEDLYKSGRIRESSNDLLRYFLQRLGTVVSETRDIEKRLENFVGIVNQFLHKSSDEKEFRYDPQLTRVSVIGKWTDKEIGLNDLSSGEKQIISLFSKLYLDTDPRFVLIDEPELSLSIDWQRQLLPFIAQAPACVQLLAITHSPFIFENELDPYAGPLIIERSTV